MRRVTIALTALLLSTSSHAAIVNGSYSGTVTSYYTSSPFFTDNASDNLSGLGITGTFQYDTSLPGYYLAFNDAPVGPYSSFGPTGAGINFTGTINGRTASVVGNTLSFVTSNNTAFQLQAVHDEPMPANGIPTTQEVLYLQATGPYVPGVTPTEDVSGFMGTGTFTLYNLTNVYPSSLPFTQVQFDLTNLTIYGSQEPLQQVPEPTSMAVLGLGLVGLWRARRARRGAAA